MYVQETRKTIRNYILVHYIGLYRSRIIILNMQGCSGCIIWGRVGGNIIAPYDFDLPLKFCLLLVPPNKTQCESPYKCLSNLIDIRLRLIVIVLCNEEWHGNLVCCLNRRHKWQGMPGKFEIFDSSLFEQTTFKLSIIDVPFLICNGSVERDSVSLHREILHQIKGYGISIILHIIMIIKKTRTIIILKRNVFWFLFFEISRLCQYVWRRWRLAVSGRALLQAVRSGQNLAGTQRTTAGLWTAISCPSCPLQNSRTWGQFREGAQYGLVYGHQITWVFFQMTMTMTMIFFLLIF